MSCILLLTLVLQAACSPPGPNSGSTLHLGLVGMVFEKRSGKEQGWQTAQRLPERGRDTLTRSEAPPEQLGEGQNASHGISVAKKRSFQRAQRCQAMDGMELHRGKMLLGPPAVLSSAITPLPGPTRMTRPSRSSMSIHNELDFNWIHRSSSMGSAPMHGCAASS